jgi:prepilin peptidase CpaA
MQTFNQGLITLLTDQPGLLVLVSLLLTAALIDAHAWRIPNALTVGGALAAVLLGFTQPDPGGWAPMAAPAGWLVGLLVALPLYLARALGGGDVKLIAMVGAFVGPSHVLAAVLLIFITGGVLALVRVARQRAWGALFMRLQSGAATSLGRMPYAWSICVGTLLYVGVFEPQGLQWSRGWPV